MMEAMIQDEATSFAKKDSNLIQNDFIALLKKN